MAKRTKTVAVYAGSFDMPTNGHLWMIERGAMMFDKLIVAVGVNPAKKPMFSVEERLQMLRDSVAWLDRNGTSIAKKIVIDEFTNKFLIRYALSVGASYILRGIRSAADYEFEKSMRNVNGDIDEGITTAFLMTPREFAEVSSSSVKGLIGVDGWEEIVKRYVPEPVFAKIVAKRKEATGGK